ncbi:MAG: hypothetical protein RPU42_14510 [Candidatus Sedimenticola sp. (ex Thyasira tokunagai)]
MSQWIEQICLPHDRRLIVQNPWSLQGGAIATNGWMLVWLEGIDTYATLDMPENVLLIERVLKPSPEALTIRNTTVKALQAWAGNYIINRCENCRGIGYFDHDHCSGGGCEGCDYDGYIDCEACNGQSWIGFDQEQLGTINGTTYNLKMIAGVVNCIGDGEVTVYIPKPSDSPMPPPSADHG